MRYYQKPPTIQAHKLKEWIRIHFLSSYLWKIPNHQRTLDIGCGYGFSFKINPHFYGIEIDEHCVRHCQQHGYQVVQANLLEPLPFSESSFDNCFSHDVLEHFELEEIEVIFKHVYHILRKEGMFMNILPNKKGFEYGIRTNAGHKYFITPEELKTLRQKQGLHLHNHFQRHFPSFSIHFLHTENILPYVENDCNRDDR